MTKERVSDAIWEHILPKLKDFEKQTWNEIDRRSNGKHHYVGVDGMNPCARKALAELGVSESKVYSLRLEGRLRIYGFIEDDGSFRILWYDDDHGDNDTCVYPSRKKHT